MAHFARLNQDNIVIRVCVVNNSKLLRDGQEVEQLGIDYLKEVHGPDSIWKKTSIHGNIRGQYAVPGMIYDEELDLFLHKKVPFDSWTLDMEHYTWEPPILQPTLTEEEMSSGKRYVWDENVYQNDTNDPKTQGWILLDPSENEPVE